MPWKLLNQSFEFSQSAWKKSYADPWNVFVPRFVDTITCPPPDIEKSAAWLFVFTRNSSTLSAGVGITPLPFRLTYVALSPSKSLVLLPPSSMNVFWSAKFPAILPLVVLPCAPLKVGAAVACRNTSEETSRLIVGNCRTAFPPRAVPMVAFSVCSSAPRTSLTSTVSVAAPTSSAMFKVRFAPVTTSCPVTTLLRNPGFVTIRSYFPGVTSLNTYRPEELLCNVIGIFVDSSTSETVAPGTVAPLGSVTRPVTLPFPVVSCPNSNVVGMKHKTKHSSQSASFCITTPCKVFDSANSYL